MFASLFDIITILSIAITNISHYIAKFSVAILEMSLRERETLTWEMAPLLHLPVCRRVEAVIVARSQVDDHVEQVVLRGREEQVLEGGRVWTQRDDTAESHH